MSERPATLRLDRLLANLGYGSRREIQALARNGRISLDGDAFERLFDAFLAEVEDRLI